MYTIYIHIYIYIMYSARSSFILQSSGHVYVEKACTPTAWYTTGATMRRCLRILFQLLITICLRASSSLHTDGPVHMARH